MVISNRKKYWLKSNTTVEKRSINSHLKYFIRNFIANLDTNISNIEDDSRSVDNIINEIEVNSSIKELQQMRTAAEKDQIKLYILILIVLSL